ncbi:MAG: recombinase family protein [Burkholderiales bacterium]|nr:recombinase family protein [Burkholderiales bacterium]
MNKNTAPQPLRTFGYARVSSFDQTTANQRQELAAAGYEIPARRWFADEGVSGKMPASQRPEFARLLTKLDEGDLLVVSKLDRLGRDVIDVLSTLDQLKSTGVRVKVLALGDTDLTSSAGKLIVGVLAVVAAMERDLLVERTQAGLARAKAEGKRLGRPPALTEEQRAEVVAQHAAGATVSELARSLGVSRATINNIRAGR